MQLLGSVTGKKSVCVPLLPFLLPGGVSAMWRLNLEQSSWTVM